MEDFIQNYLEHEEHSFTFFIERPCGAYVMRNLRRHMLLWRKVHRRDKSDCGHQVERTQHPIHRKIGPIQTSLQQRHTHLHMENPDESSSKTPTKKNFRELFYCKIQAKN